jgi:hypothetical protein
VNTLQGFSDTPAYQGWAYPAPTPWHWISALKLPTLVAMQVDLAS